MSRLRPIFQTLAPAAFALSCSVAETIKKPLEETTGDGEVRTEPYGSTETDKETSSLKAVIQLNGSQTKLPLKASWTNAKDKGKYTPGNTGGASTLSLSGSLDEIGGEKTFQVSLGKESFQARLDLKECDFVEALGYDVKSFQDLTAYYSILPKAGLASTETRAENPPTLNSLARMEYASGEDAKAVSCGLLPPPSSQQRVIEVEAHSSETESLHIYSQDKLIVPKQIRLATTGGVKHSQIFRFVFEQDVSPSAIEQAIVIKTKYAETAKTLSFESCAKTFPKEAKSLNYTVIRLGLSQEGEISESDGTFCCYSTGSCSSATP